MVILHLLQSHRLFRNPVLVLMDRAVRKDRAFQDWLTGTATFLVLKEPVQQAVFLCVRQRWQRADRFIQHLPVSEHTIHTPKQLRIERNCWRIITAIWSRVSMMPIHLQCVSVSDGPLICIMARVWSNWWSYMICIVWMIWHWRTSQIWSADLQILVREQLWQVTSVSEILIISSIRELILVPVMRIFRHMRQKVVLLSLLAMQELPVIWLRLITVMDWWQSTCIILRCMWKWVTMLRKASRLVWVVRQATQRAITFISR